MSKNNSALGLGVLAILLTTFYTAILASQLMSTKHKVDYLYFKNKFSHKEKTTN
ncbi:Uncharacterised protein [Niallia circulans]|uniref:hypothetical protein n=1 Tax=Niallia circulans TaxID=1397 RepID=UPI000A9E764B|nr:hypothetical protein [Niallia circulans]MED3841658.1 hypothetical protein [Niallia circulans]MED4243394.1 hypothetical protein [Niallia circulans]MED4248301.1 hypothetical protein [Niallia circulans]QKH62346.1 hypothetical protein FOC77_17700 [Niallia circulans]SPT86110.1 Uncharacterised protein [Niallia circulans]